MEEEITLKPVHWIILLLILGMAIAFIMYQSGTISKIYSFVFGTMGYFS